MQENLVIVESPAKAKTIEKILGDKYTVKSSYGHIRDLKKKGLSIDIAKGFEPEYEISPDKVKVVSELKKLSKEAQTVWLASDEDREGEAIAWHLKEALQLPDSKTRRIVFHEITQNAILHAVENPRQVDRNLVNAQQARRVLDRLVGFELSPLLWRKVRPSLSAGRVQSVTVRLIVEREREIMNFEGSDYYRVVGEFAMPDGAVFKAELNTRFKTEEEAGRFLADISAAGVVFTVGSVETKPSKRTPAAPFTTSTLQQEAARKLGFSVSQTMSVAQRLYEAGLITYMRTDSVHLSSLAIGAAEEAVAALFGEKYHKTRQYTTKSKGAQEAHEAIRPTDIDRREAGTTAQERRLYDLIWKRTVASQMADAELEKTTAQIVVSNRSEKFAASGEVITFDGFLRLYMESRDDEVSAAKTDGSGDGLLPAMTEGTVLTRGQTVATQRFAQRPPRYSEASLVKHLEELGIGRPSTYAPTISTIINRGYVVKEDRDGVKRDYTVLTLSKAGGLKRTRKSEMTGAEKNKLFPTDIGMLVTDYLAEHFAAILDYNFTARVEKEFDEIAEGGLDWRRMLAAFYAPFHEHVDNAEGETEYVRSERLLGVDPKTGKNVYARVGKFGPMVQLGDTPAAASKAKESSEPSEDEKPRYASLLKGQMVATITLEEALALFELPRELGEYEGKTVTAAVGRFGPYVKHDGKFVSLKVREGDDPYTVTLERAVQLIEEKREAERNRVIRVYEAEDIQVLNGRWGPYIAHGGTNYKIPKTLLAKREAASLTLEELRALIAEQQTAGEGTAPKRTFRRGVARGAKK
ncbi:type I DNA topoisomerase [Rikenella microfusus]|uniref:DNA topoisomerase 1 n=1 Tax=Rikenella microfusus TaxID=28139 RepID=A0A379MPT7_9BACT|nr:type I DNA topoisomerase [Rikenella microfusus]SUE32900.1 DNA topoisomerase 1 [Rikenella microfusus]HJE88870.1 type I DNA topoisomerase [Rikenella microfusus]